MLEVTSDGTHWIRVGAILRKGGGRTIIHYELDTVSGAWDSIAEVRAWALARVTKTTQPEL